VITLAAKTEGALTDLAQAYLEYLGKHPEAKLADIAYTSKFARSQFQEHRIAVVARDRAELEDILSSQAWIRGSKPETEDTIAFLCTGQGSQYVNMGRELYEESAVFRSALDECADLLSGVLEAPLLQLLFSDGDLQKAEEALKQTKNTQPALFCIVNAPVVRSSLSETRH